MFDHDTSKQLNLLGETDYVLFTGSFAIGHMLRIAHIPFVLK